MLAETDKKNSARRRAFSNIKICKVTINNLHIIVSRKITHLEISVHDKKNSFQKDRITKQLYY